MEERRRRGEEVMYIHAMTGEVKERKREERFGLMTHIFGAFFTWKV